MDGANSAFLRRVLAMVVLAMAIGVWSGCPDDGGGENDGGQDSGQDSGSGADGGSDAGGDAGDGCCDAGADAGSDAGSDAGGGIDPSLDVRDQSPALSTEVVITGVTAAAAGWVVVNAPLSDGGATSGFSPVSIGTSSLVKVAVGDPLVNGTTVAAELHQDLGAAGTYEPGVDPLVQNNAGMPVQGTFLVTVPAGTPAVRYTFSPTFNGSAFVWRVAAAPARFASTLSTTGDNPQLTLFTGWRYEAVDPAFGVHPFELANATGSDTILLSQKADAGTMKDDPTIAWEDGRNASGASRFTLSPSLQAQLNLYRCGVHFGSMRSPVVIQTR
ncbi:MAG TPA: hypothetical protein VIG99_11915 [Myxococcaceae bacterium]|jgi:hypothetical protein